MSALLFLGLAALIAALGLAVIAVRSRDRTPWEEGIESFQDHLESLKPRDDDAVRWAMKQVGRVDEDGRTSAGS